MVLGDEAGELEEVEFWEAWYFWAWIPKRRLQAMTASLMAASRIVASRGSAAS